MARMNRDEKRVALAKLDGIKEVWSYALPKRVIRCDVPDYLNDLNAIHRLEKQAPMGYVDFVRMVVARDAGVRVCDICDQYVYLADADQRAEALLRIHELWTE